MSAEFLTSPQLSGLKNIRHAFFTRHGGVSDGPYNSLNLGRLKGQDTRENVEANRARAAKALGLERTQLAFRSHAHAGEVLTLTSPTDSPASQVDGLVTNVPGIALPAICADCAPILLADPEARVIGALHASWMSTLADIVPNTVKAMQALGANPAAMTAVVGPCMQQASFEIQQDVEQAFLHYNPASEAFIRRTDTANPAMHLNLPGFLCRQLTSLGVNAHSTGHNTYAEEADFFSSRRSRHRGEDWGAMASLITLD